MGDFLQLPPVQNLFDPGAFAFNSPIFVKSILHRVELETVWRQHSSETKFLQCLNELRIGICSEESSNFIQNLSRELPYSIGKDAVHIFFRRLPMQVHNANMLFNTLPETELFKFDAIDTVYSTQYTANTIYQAEKTLVLKPGCRVMLSNLSDTLHNGSTGVFVGAKEEELVVEFDNVGRIAIKRETWEKRSRSGSVVASRRQFPLSLAYDITCHKSQSLTIPAAVVHCSKEFTPA